MTKRERKVESEKDEWQVRGGGGPELAFKSRSSKRSG